MAEQTYTERAVTNLPVGDVNATSLVRIDEDLIEWQWLQLTAINGMKVALRNFTLDSFDDDLTPVINIVLSAASPDTAGIMIGSSDSDLVASLTPLVPSGVAIGYVDACNVFPSKLWVTTDQTEPPSASNGQFWIRPVA